MADYYTQFINDTANSLGISPGIATIILSLILIWTLIWKGFALWKSAKKNHSIWFIIMLIINTIGILEILYIYVFSEINLDKKSKTKENKKSSKPIKKKTKR
jgi:hypothetical protein